VLVPPRPVGSGSVSSDASPRPPVTHVDPLSGPDGLKELGAALCWGVVCVATGGGAANPPAEAGGGSAAGAGGGAR
jgi:hypothetical protein